jgi:hypothetical protein
MAAQRPKPTYDELAASLRAHRDELRLMRNFLHDTGLNAAMQADVLRVAGFIVPQELLYSHDPIGGEAPETTRWREMASQVRAEERFILAVQGMARAQPKPKPSELRVVMGAGKGRGQRVGPY